jgi:DNA-binding NarL/FixJ family response regulator
VIWVFIIAASPLSPSGLEGLLKARAIKVSGFAANVESAGPQLSDTRTDVVLIEAAGEQPEQFVRSLVESDLASDLPMIVLADHLPRASSAALLRSGIRAVLPSDISRDRLLSALQAVVSGLVVVEPEDIEAITATTADASRPVDEPLEPLTRREHEVLQMLAAGLGNKEIAAQLTISEHTVKFHVASILGKLGAESRTEAASLAIRQGLVLL